MGRKKLVRKAEPPSKRGIRWPRWTGFRRMTVRDWLPMWPRANGAYVYLPSGADGSADAPSDFFNQVHVKLETIGLESPTWTYKYNSGANPIEFAIPREKATHSAIREILTEAYELA